MATDGSRSAGTPSEGSTATCRPARAAEVLGVSTAAMDWSALTPLQRLAVLDLMKTTMQAELDRSAEEINAVLREQGCPAEVEIEVRMRIDPNRDPRLGR